MPPLPVPLTPLVGREHEEAALDQVLRQARTRLVTLTGPGGVGKTRLALQVASGLGDAFPDGIGWIDLTPVREPGRVLPAVARVFGLREEGEAPVDVQLITRLRDARLLLVLDNLEQVVAAIPTLVAVLEVCPGVVVLATSRVVLRVRGEREYVVPPLALPAVTQLPDLGALAQVPAVALFLARGQAVRPTLVLTGELAPVLVAICARLDGLPLALELAAARLRLFAPQTLLMRLERRLPLLTGGARDLPARHQTLHDTIAWSYDLLAPAEQALFRRLGVFVGGCTLAAIEAVCSLPEDVVLEGLAALREQSLLRFVDDDDAEPRIMLLETILEFALERLMASGGEEDTRRRYVGHYLALAEEAVAHLHGPVVGHWMRLLDRERENLHGALTWALMQGETTVALRMGTALGSYWSLSGQVRAGRGWLEAALILPYSTEAAPWRGAALVRAGRLADLLGDPAAAHQHFEAALAWYHAAGDRAACEEFQADLEIVRIELETSLSQQQLRVRRRAALEADRVRCERTGDTAGMAMAALNLGRMLGLEGRWVEARPLLEESLALARRHGHAVISVYASLHLGLGALQTGAITTAAAYYDAALHVAAEAADRTMMAYGLEALVGVAAARGEGLRAAFLGGAAAAARGAQELPLAGEELALYEGWVAAARTQIDSGHWERAWTAGQALPLEQAVAAALREPGDHVLLREVGHLEEGSNESPLQPTTKHHQDR